jgi:diguanylate cyclase (GGDEF)-like protein
MSHSDRAAGWRIRAALLAVLWPLHSWALSPQKAFSQYVRTVWTTEAGLPQNSVYSMAQTPDGYLWVGTEQGLARFDGAQFYTFDRRNTPELPANYIHRLLAMPDGSLWIGTDSGLTRLQNGHWTTWTSEAPPTTDGHPAGTARISDDDIEALSAGRNGCVWIGTGRGLDRICGDHVQVWHAADGLPSEGITALELDQGGTLWIGMHSGLAAFDGTHFRAIRPQEGPPDPGVTALALAPDGSIWAGTPDGRLLREAADRIRPVRAALPRNDIDSLTFDGDGNLWIGLQDYGLARLHDGAVTMAESTSSLPGHTVEALLVDREHSLWVGFFDGGLMQLRDGRFTVWGKPEGLSSNVICCAVESRDGSLWVAAADGTLNRIAPDGRVRVYTARDGLPAEGIHSLLLAHDGTLWIGHRHGTLTRMGVPGRFNTYRDPLAADAAFNALLEDSEGQIWVGSYGAGLMRFVHGRFVHVTATGAVVALAQTPDGAIWAGTDGDGLLRLLDGRIQRFTIANGLLSDHIISLLADSDGSLWVGCTAAGLNLIRNGYIRSFTQNDGLSDATAGDLVEDSFGNLWMGSDYGIFRVSKLDLTLFAEGKIPSIPSADYDTADGLRSRETLQGGTNIGSIGWDGRLLYPTMSGLAVAYPSQLLAPVPPLQPRIESVRLNGRMIPVSDRLRLNPGSFRLEIQYTAISFLAPSRIRFRYRLEGYDNSWVDPGEGRTAVFTSLPAGDYVFRVEAMPHNGAWSSQAAALRFTIPLPWYRTPLAWLLWVVAVLLLGWAAVEMRTRRLVHLRRELECQVGERTQQLENEKAELARARAELQIQATHDSLTGLWNRAAILDHLQREAIRAMREGTPLAVALADLDHFKQINDNYGHLCGDRILREAALRLRNCLRAYDLLGRYGGEEFLIVMPGCDPGRSPERVQQLVASICGAHFADPAGVFQMTCSVGVTVLRPGSKDVTMEDLLHCADNALYRAKTEGRNRIHFDELKQNRPGA